MSKGSRLKYLRESVGLGQTEAANRVGISKQTLYKYEKDIITNIPSDIIEGLASLYESTPSYIMGWDAPAASSGSSPAASADDFSALEKEIVYKFRQADEFDQETVLRTLHIKRDELYHSLGGVG